jgi:hypothetical protein
MKTLPIILLVVLIGCSRSETPNRASQISQQIQRWVPMGTSVTAARQIMEQHQFVCTVSSYDSRAAMPPGSDPIWWEIGRFIGRDGKAMPVTNVTILDFKQANCSARLSAVNGETDGRYSVFASR